MKFEQNQKGVNQIRSLGLIQVITDLRRQKDNMSVLKPFLRNKKIETAFSEFLSPHLRSQENMKGYKNEKSRLGQDLRKHLRWRTLQQWLTAKSH